MEHPFDFLINNLADYFRASTSVLFLPVRCCGMVGGRRKIDWIETWPWHWLLFYVKRSMFRIDNLDDDVSREHSLPRHEYQWRSSPVEGLVILTSSLRHSGGGQRFPSLSISLVYSYIFRHNDKIWTLQINLLYKQEKEID